MSIPCFDEVNMNILDQSGREYMQSRNHSSGYCLLKISLRPLFCILDPFVYYDLPLYDLHLAQFAERSKSMLPSTTS